MHANANFIVLKFSHTVGLGREAITDNWEFVKIDTGRLVITKGFFDNWVLQTGQFLFEMCLPGIMVAVFIRTNIPVQDDDQN